MSLSAVPTLLKELLNMVYHKGKSWDLYSPTAIVMIYLYINHQTLQNAVRLRMTQHFTHKNGRKKVSCKFKKHNSFVLTILQCGATLITCSLTL